MRKPIIIAVVSTCVALISRIIMAGIAFKDGEVSLERLLLSLIITSLIIIGLIKGHRLAWQWGRILGLFVAIILTIISIQVFTGISAKPEEMKPAEIMFAILIALQGLPLFLTFFALGTIGAKEHFQLICPECGNSKVKGGDFFFTKVTCRKCDATWNS